MLDEEIDRLPRRYREAVLLCEIEGASRQDAARRLGLPEGTLSSRLARGRTLLRNRLSKRGVTLAAGTLALISEPANAALPEPLAHSTVQLTLKFAAGGAATGMVPAAVSSLAEGVLRMMFAARLKLILITAISLSGAACLTVGLAWAVAANRRGEPAEIGVPAVVAQVPRDQPDGRTLETVTGIRGVVVDEAGRSVELAEVQADAFMDNAPHPAATAADGSFAIGIRRREINGLALLASVAGSDRLGFYQYGDNILSRAAARAPVRIVLKPGENVLVHVTDSNHAPVQDAAVQVAGNSAILDYRKTGRDGSARLNVPSDARVEWIYALKSGQGFDYAEYGQIDANRRSQGGSPASSLPRSVDLKLDGVRTVRIKAVNGGRQPLSWIGFHPWLLHKQGRRSCVTISSHILSATTGPDGIATFDWLPPSNDLLQFWPVGESYADRRVTVEVGQTGFATARLDQKERIRGRVVQPDGSPAVGMQVSANFSGAGRISPSLHTQTAADGSYELTVEPGKAYSVHIDDKVCVSPSSLAVIVPPGRTLEGADFQLVRGTIVHGKVTVEPGNRPAANQFIRLDETGSTAPSASWERRANLTHEIRQQFETTTNSGGEYSIRVGPGTYALIGPPGTQIERITIHDELELVRDFRIPRPDKATLTGQVVLAGQRNQGIPAAVVELAAADILSTPVTLKADSDGRFQAERSPGSLVVCARSADGKLGAIVELGANDSQVVIPLTPTATATGILLDELGKPAANRRLTWGRRVYVDDGKTVSMLCFAPEVATDRDGKFALPSLVIGQEYEIAVEREYCIPAAGAIRPEKASMIDLGTLQIGTYRGKSTAGQFSSFR